MIDRHGSRSDTQPENEALLSYIQQASQYELLSAKDEVELAICMEEGLRAKAQLEDEPSNHSRHTLDELTVSVKAGEEAKERFINSNLKLVIKYARGFESKAGKLGLLDLIQEGNTGLMRAVEKFDWRKGFKFSTYATWWIWQALDSAIRIHSRTIRVPRSVHENLNTLHNTKNELGVEIITPEVLEDSGVDISPGNLEKALVMDSVDSIDAPLASNNGSGPASPVDFIADNGGQDSTNELANVVSMNQAIRELGERLGSSYAQVIIYRFGLDGEGRRTVEECIELMGLSKEAIKKQTKHARQALHQILGEELLWY